MSARLVAVVLTVAAAGCGDGTLDTPTSPSVVETTAQTTQSFTGTLPTGGLRFYSFTLPRDGAFSVVLGSLQTAPTAASPEVEVGLGIGIPAGTGCAVREAVVTTPALVRQLAGWATQGIHCVAIFDVGGLTEPVSFAIRLTHY